MLQEQLSHSLVLGGHRSHLLWAGHAPNISFPTSAQRPAPGRGKNCAFPSQLACKDDYANATMVARDVGIHMGCPE